MTTSHARWWREWLDRKLEEFAAPAPEDVTQEDDFQMAERLRWLDQRLGFAQDAEALRYFVISRFAGVSPNLRCRIGHGRLNAPSLIATVQVVDQGTMQVLIDALSAISAHDGFASESREVTEWWHD